MENILSKVSEEEFYKILENKEVDFFSTESSGFFNFQGIQPKNPIHKGKIVKSGLGELLIVCGNDKHYLDYKDYVGVATDEYDDVITNSFFFLENHLIVILTKPQHRC